MKNNIISFFYNFLLKKKLVKSFSKRGIIILRVLQINKKYVILDGNLKSECFVKISQFFENGVLEIKVGDFIEVFLVNIENICNRVVVSRSKCRRIYFWKKIFKFYRTNNFIKGKVLSKIKGGYLILIMNFKCFLPFSCSDKKLSNISYYLNRYLYFYILNFNFLKKNVILSRKVVISRISLIKKRLFFNNVKPGFIIRGVIRSFTNYCLFIDIGYLDCLIFYKNLMWGNYRYFASSLRIGISIIGVVLKIDKVKNRVFLGFKQLFNPWKKNIKLLCKYFKYVRILKITYNKIYVVICKNIIASTRNNFGFYIFNFLKINDFRKIRILSFNFKKKRINFKFEPPLA